MLLLGLDIGGVRALEMFGTPDPWTVSLQLPNRVDSLPDATNVVALMPEAVTVRGQVFAVTARLHNPEFPFYFQIWRPTGTADEFQLIASRQITPSVGQDQFENVRLNHATCLLGPFRGAIAVPSVTRCRCCRCRCCCGHRCAGGVRQ